MFSLSRIPFCKTEICVNDHTNQSWDKWKALILLTTTSQKMELARECQCSKRKIDGSFISNIVRNSQHKKLNRNPHTVQISHGKEMSFFRPVPTCLRSYLSTLEYINNCPTRCEMQRKAVYLLFSKFTLHFRVSTKLITRSTQNCNYSLRYWSYFLYGYIPSSWPRAWPRWGRKHVELTYGIINRLLYLMFIGPCIIVIVEE